MYTFFSVMVMPWIDVLSYDFFLFSYSERCLGQKPLLRKRYYTEFIKTIRHNNTDLKKRYLGQKPLLRKRYYTELIETIRHNNADLKKRYLGQKPLLRKRYYYELIETIRHNNADLKKGCIPQTNRDDGWMLGAVQEVIIQGCVTQNELPMRVAKY